MFIFKSYNYRMYYLNVFIISFNLIHLKAQGVNGKIVWVRKDSPRDVVTKSPFNVRVTIM